MDVLVALIDNSRGGEGRYPVRHYLAYMYLLADEDDAAIEPHGVDNGEEEKANNESSKQQNTYHNKTQEFPGLRTPDNWKGR